MGGNTCFVEGCGASSHDSKGKSLKNGLSFYSFPSWTQNRGAKISALTKRRRKAWMKAAGETGKKLQISKIPRWIKVCSRHFHSGQPAHMLQEDDPDWVPSLHMRPQPDTGKKPPASSPTPAAAAEVDDGLGDEEEGSGDLEEGSQEASHCGAAQEPEAKRSRGWGCEACTERRQRLNGLQAEAEDLRYEVEGLRLGEGFLEGEERVRYYTGLHSPAALMGLLQHLRPHLVDPEPEMPAAPARALSPFQKLLLTLMRLRLDLPVPHLAHLLDVSPDAVMSAFNQTLTALYTHLRPLVYWPERADLLLATPKAWAAALFGSVSRGRAVLVAESLEVPIARPTSPLGRQQSYSATRHGYAMKYLVVSTGRGAVALVSAAAGARVTGLELAERSMVSERMACGDFLLLVDRQEEEVFKARLSLNAEARGASAEPRLICALVKGAAFGRGQRMFEVKTPASGDGGRWEELRQPVGRVLEGLKSHYRLLDATAPISSLLPGSGTGPDQLPPLLDQMVTVCCALFNLSPSTDQQGT